MGHSRQKFTFDRIYLMSDIYALIGSRIREERTLRGQSIEKLAEAAEMASSFLGSVERGERKLSVLTLDKISRVLNTQTSDLMTLQGKRPMEAWERRSISLIKSLPDSSKEPMFKILYCLAKNLRLAKQ
ncbi:MAG: helix-turn-helix transcriptional regulator [Elusimicrobia bacterium]|nr:helix-turn-helix transcriptional regulator [Elusimicrobiota bacterium]